MSSGPGVVAVTRRAFSEIQAHAVDPVWPKIVAVAIGMQEFVSHDESGSGLVVERTRIVAVAIRIQGSDVRDPDPSLALSVARRASSMGV